MDVVEKYFADKGKVAIHDAEVTLQEMISTPLTDLLREKQSKTATGIIRSIREALGDFTGKKLLDVGCGVGWFTFLLTEAGASVTGVESDPVVANVAERIRVLKGYYCDIVNTEISRYLALTAYCYDATLLLNVLDQMLRANEEDAWNALRKIRERSKHVFIMAGATEQLPNMAGLRTEHPKWVPLQPQKESWEMGHEMIMRKGGFSDCERLLRNSYAMRDLWLFC